MRRHAWLGILVLVSVTLASLDAGTEFGGRFFESVRALTGMGIGPVQEGTASLVRANDTQPAELRRLRIANARLTAQNGRLRSVVDRGVVDGVDTVVVDDGPIAGRVVALGPDQRFGQTATLDVGAADRVRKGAGVFAPEGIVGRVLRVGRTTSVVLLVTDPQSTVGARLVSSGELGMVRGNSSAKPTLTMLDPTVNVGIGDRVVSWGSRGGRPYPPKVPIGTVEAVRKVPGIGATARVRPAADVTALDRVAVAR